MNIDITYRDSDSKTVVQWKQWSERTANGLWEGDQDHSIGVSPVDTIIGVGTENAKFFTCLDFTIASDTLFIIDDTKEQLVCMGIDGTVYWRYGEPGEGPGHFAGLNSVSIGPGWVVVGEAYGSNIEILSRSGELIRNISFQNPNDLITINDTTFAVLSRISDGGDIHVFSINSGYLTSFGSGDWQNQRSYWNTELYGLYMLANSCVFAVSQFENQLYRYSLEDTLTSTNLAKEYPAEIPQQEATSEGIRVYPILGSPFIGPEGMVNVHLGGMGFNTDGCVISNQDETRIPVTIIDRYNPTGQYLDSYCIPCEDLITQVVYSQEYGFLCSIYDLGIIIQYEH